MNSLYLILTALALTRLGFPENATQKTLPCTQAIPNLQVQSAPLSGHHGYGLEEHCPGTAPPPTGQTCTQQGKSPCTPASARTRNLFEAAKKHPCSAVKVIIEEGADINAKDSDGSTALMWAAWRNELDAAKLLIQSGADVNAKDSKAVTALMYASEKNSHHVAKLLIEKGADINEKNNKGETALMWAAWRDSAAVTTLLLEQGADVNAKDKAGKSALDVANSEEMKKLLREHGAK